jgi:predicted glycoside hydrolase/deacetylase ChbG (UPF0249 family)
MIECEERSVEQGATMGTAHFSPVVRTAAPVRTRLIVHADDFGETVEITSGICQAIEAGAVTSTSIMANMPGSEDALRRAAALSGRASFGVHLNLCEGRALTGARSLTDTHGFFHRKRALFARAVAGQLAPPELEAEITAQIGRIHDAGVRISHVDGHKHLHQLPLVRDVVAAVLPRFGIERVRVTRLGRLSELRAPATLMREALAWQARRIFRRAHLRSPARIVDLQAIMRRTQRHREPAMQLGFPGPIELFCHPGTPLADVEKPGSCRRANELDFLLSPGFRNWLAAQGAQLVSYWDL